MSWIFRKGFDKIKIKREKKLTQNNKSRCFIFIKTICSNPSLKKIYNNPWIISLVSSFVVAVIMYIINIPNPINPGNKLEEIRLPVDTLISLNTIEMVTVPSGIFMCGNTKVNLKSYNIGKYEVTQAQWTAVMNNNPSYFKGDNLPVENVSWDTVQIFIEKLNHQTGKKYRLPTEEEWVYAAMGGNKTHNYIYSGSNNVDDVAWYKGNSKDKTHPVGTKAPNELGIYDMSGNVWEWCSDCHQFSNTCYYLIRGGSWLYDESNVRISINNYVVHDFKSEGGTGFRLVCDSK
ncbi:hypothetical protein FACS1894182_03260 [Bacteroidia bacterium]|nr:hypothetical protein FACS1894182_03260 [Bacteroidia bacterium]